jgi:uncharacterized protein
MSDPFVPRIGGVLSADIAFPDHERAVRFYSRVLTTGADPLWREDLMNSLGLPVIGLGSQAGEYAHLPLQWMPHIQVADVAASVQRAQDLGGDVLMHSRDDQGNSQWAVLRDPNGAAFGIIPVIPTEAIPPETEAASPGAAAQAGCIAWLDLTVSDAAATRDFYRRVVGWGVRDVAMKDADNGYADYEMLGDDGTPAAGVCHARGVNADLPPVWLIYLPVSDLPESLRRAREEGGAVVKEVRGGDGRVVYAVVQDPAAAYFVLCQSTKGS